jgi:hypothetical protein
VSLNIKQRRKTVSGIVVIVYDEDGIFHGCYHDQAQLVGDRLKVTWQINGNYAAGARYVAHADDPIVRLDAAPAEVGNSRNAPFKNLQPASVNYFCAVLFQEYVKHG